MRKDSSGIILGSFILGVTCILGIFFVGAAGLAGWSANLRRQPLDAPGTPLPATPVRAIPQTIPPASTPTAAETEGAPPDAVILASPETTAPAFPAPGEPLAGSATEVSAPPVLLDSNCIPLNNPSARARVLRVLDGITIEVEENGEVYEVRYIGTALADSSQDPTVFTRAAAQNSELVEGKLVLLIRDRTDRDPDGRRPRYVLAGSVFVNLEIVRRGYATTAESPPDLSCRGVLLEAERQAVGAALGLWAPEPTTTRTLIPVPTATTARIGLMTITSVAKRGTIWQEPEEYVEFRNDSSEPLQLQDWTLQDNERHVFTFPEFTLGPGQYCRVYTNEYHPTSCGFSYYSPSPIWSNEQDCAYLKDPFGAIVSTFCYGYP